MDLNYLEYLDLLDALVSGKYSTKRLAETTADEEERKYWEEKIDRYEELKKKLKHYAADNLF